MLSPGLSVSELSSHTSPQKGSTQSTTVSNIHYELTPRKEERGRIGQKYTVLPPQTQIIYLASNDFQL